MKPNGYYELSDVPRMMERWERSGKSDAGALLSARAGLLDAVETAMENAAKESRGLTPDETRAFDEHMAQIREINAELAKVKARLIAERGVDMIRVPF